ncbi:hypothetical protein Q5752_003545 [Cryptotrichosporon argae]
MSIRYTPHGGDADSNLLGSPPAATGFKSPDDHPADDTTAALSNLFNPYDPELDLSIDPSLSAADNAQPAATLADPLPTGLALGDAPPADVAADTPPVVPAKRKATSRINMLARGAACEFCKRRKLKCSAEETGCASCARAGVACEYKQTKQRSRVRVLEDRLVELERRLGQQRESDAGAQAQSGSSAYVSPAQTDASPAAALDAPAFEDGALFGLDSAATGLDAQEPDLMTLAAAAAADGPGSGTYVWDNLKPHAIADEVNKAASGGKGVGEKIIAHALHLYALLTENATLAGVHSLLNPKTSTARLLSPTQPPHPSLVIALAALVLPHSPSRTLARAPLSELLVAASRTSAQQAFATLESRLVDVVVAGVIRAHVGYAQSHFVDGWNEAASAVGLAWAAGLGKLGHVEDAWSGSGAGRPERMAVEQRRRLVIRKGQLVPPATESNELKERIDVFWGVYLADRVGAIGWGWTSLIIAAEVSTPLPADDGAPSMGDMTLSDFLAGNLSTAATDSVHCAAVKAVTLAYEASRLLDLALPTVRERAPKLLAIAHAYTAGWRAFSSPTPEAAPALGQVNTVWMYLHLARFFIHAGSWANAAPHTDPLALAMADAEMVSAVDAAEAIAACIDDATRAGDAALDGYGTMAAAAWHTVGRAAWLVAADISAADPAKAARLRAVGTTAQHALAVKGKRLPFAATHAQLVLGNDSKIGYWARADNIELAPASAAGTRAHDGQLASGSNV